MLIGNDVKSHVYSMRRTLCLFASVAPRVLLSLRNICPFILHISIHGIYPAYYIYSSVLRLDNYPLINPFFNPFTLFNLLCSEDYLHRAHIGKYSHQVS